jgi:RHS repeat-associated protein
MERRLSLALVTLIATLTTTDASAAVGRTAGQFAVSSTGAAQYSIPIWTPPGVRGVQPFLALLYDSRSSYGLMGPGWNLGGLSSITRCNRTYAQDGTPAPITLTTADGLCLDGNRLRTTGTGTYQTEIANFSQVTASGTAGNGPSYFTVQGKDGLTYEYGNTTDSKILSTGSSTPYTWALDKVTDRAGNQMTFTYSQANGSFVPLSIQYTAPSGSTSFPYQINFAYTTKSANDTISKYIAASQIQQTKQLSTINVTSSGTTVREYKLLYTTSSTTLRATLTSIQECGGSAGTDCLAPTTVGYQQGTAGFATPTTATGSGATDSTHIYSVDIDGDGRQDLVFARYDSATSSYQWWVQFANASGYGAPINTGAVSSIYDVSILLDTFDGTGANQILVPVGGIWYFYKWNGSTFNATSTGTAYQGGRYASADVDGDGRPDLVYLGSTGTSKPVPIYVQLNTSTAGAISFANPVLVSTLPITTREIIGNNMISQSSVKHYDFDGDGRQDLIIILSMTGTNPQQTPLELLSRYPAPFVLNTNIVTNQGTGLILPVNWNDDACTDLIVGATLYLSQCNGALGSTYTFPAPPSLALDWDGDGRTDALVSGATWQLYRSLGGAGPAPAVSTTTSGGSFVTDKDGDGLDDVIGFGSGGVLYYGPHNAAGVRPDLATSFTDGYGNSVSPSYVPITKSNYSAWGDQLFPYENYIGPLYVAYQATFSDPSSASGSTYDQMFWYAGASMNLQGRGFAGFGAQQRYDSRNGVWETKNRARVFPYTGMLTYDVAAQDNLNTKPISIQTNTPASLTLDGTANNERYFPYFSNVTATQREVGGPENGDLITTSSTNYTYDHYGNATTVARTVTDNDPGSPYLNDTWTSTTVNTISPNTSTWCLTLPTETQITNSSSAPGGAAIARTVSYTPDYTNCRETEKVIEPNSATYKVVEDYGFDSFGNLHTDTVTGVGMTPRVTTTTWNSTGQFPATIQNPLSQSITLGFDPNTGMKVSQTDPNSTTSNPLATSWHYDNFARKIQENRPDGTYTVWTYNDCASWGGCLIGSHALALAHYVYNTNNSIQNDGTTYFDQVDRPLMANTMMLSGAYDRSEVRYDSLARVTQQAMPCTYTAVSTPCTYWTSFGYDVLNRVMEAERPVNASSSQTYCTPTMVPPLSGCEGTAYSYQGRTTTVTDPQGKNTTKINLVTGSLARTQDHNGYNINFKYDAFGSVLSVTDSLSNTLNTMTYDYGLQAFQRTSNDADLGPRSSTYDALGELKSYSDAKGQNFSVIYDALSRPTSRTEPDLTTTWTWGNTASSFNIGKLQSVAAASSTGTYSEVYGYDSKTRLSTKTITIPGDTSYTYTSTYNTTTELLDTLQYPVSTSSYHLKLQYTYANGILKEISDAAAGTRYWLADTINPRGQWTQETLGNGIVINHAFDAVTGWAGSIQAGVGSGAGLQNNSYLFDEVGNLTQRQDNNRGLTENIYYDNLYRLDHTTLTGATNLALTYDAMGDILTTQTDGSSIVDTRNYTTKQTGCTYYGNSQPHAVRSDTHSALVTSFCYDANGNTTAITAAGLPYGSSTWTSYNQPSGINGPNSSSSQFFYNADHQRYKQIAAHNGTTETTIYVGGLLEKVTLPTGTAYRHYIPAGSNTIIATRWSTGTNPTYYVTNDHLGSSSVITDATGALVVNENFGALGRRRGDNWTGSPTTAEMTQIVNVTQRGFTGQEMLDNLSFVNMNGRIYGGTGNFISPDPYIPNPGYTQSYNRYSYVNNNPLSQTDPTGFENISGARDQWARDARHGKTLAIRQRAAFNIFSFSLTDWYAQAAGEFGFGGGGGGADSYVPGTSSNGTTVDQQGAVGAVVSNLNAGQQTLARNYAPTASTSGTGAASTTTTPPATETGDSAQSQASQSQTSGLQPVSFETDNSSSDAVILYPKGDGQGYINTLSVDLAPGANSLTVTVNNIDTSLSAYIMASTGSQVRLTFNLEAQTANGPISGSQNFSQALAPGDSTFFSVPNFMGPGQAALQIINTGGFTTAVILTATPQTGNWRAGP